MIVNTILYIAMLYLLDAVEAPWWIVLVVIAGFALELTTYIIELIDIWINR